MAFHIVTISSLLHLQCCTGMHWEWGMGNGEWGMGNGNGEWGMGRVYYWSIDFQVSTSTQLAHTVR